MATAPFIPETAPFTPDQRAWLNGLLVGLFGEAVANAAPQSTVAALKIAVLYASQSGTGESLARKVMKDLKAKGHTVTLTSLDAFTPAALAKEEYAIIIASTYGEGEPPESVRPFYDQLCLETAPRLEKLSYTVLALGDKNYEQFCKFGIELDERLHALGANHLADRMDCDVDLDEAFAAWKAGVYGSLQSIAGAEDSMQTRATVITMPTAKATASAQAHTRDNPFLAPLVERRALTKDVSSKQTLHLALSIAESKVHYEAGDACGVIPQNDPLLVAQILDAVKFTGDEQVEVAKVGATALYTALLESLQITRLSRKIVQAYAAMGNCTHLLELLVPEQQTHFDDYIYDRGVIDLLTEYPGVITDPAELVAMLPRLTPRLYSISSSPLAHPGEIHTTVAVVRYRSHNMERGGVCSTMFADRTSVGEALPIYIQPNKKFRLPEDDAPMIMIGPGTGIAPFRSFLHERRARGSKGRNWLFFGERSAKTDFLYRSEIEAMLNGKHLSLLDTAFSRDQNHKIYVQDRMLEQASAFWKWLQDGASVYVCGDASRMAKDVDAALHTIVERQGHLGHEAAQDYVLRLKEENRYHRDVY